MLKRAHKTQCHLAPAESTTLAFISAPKPHTQRQNLTENGDGHWPRDGGVCCGWPVSHGPAVQRYRRLDVGIVHKAVHVRILVMASRRTWVRMRARRKRCERVARERDRDKEARGTADKERDEDEGQNG